MLSQTCTFSHPFKCFFRDGTAIFALHIPQHQLGMFGRCAFFFARPTTFHSLPDSVWNPNVTEAVFGRSVETLLFTQYWHIRHVRGSHWYVRCINACIDVTIDTVVRTLASQMTLQQCLW